MASVTAIIRLCCPWIFVILLAACAGPVRAPVYGQGPRVTSHLPPAEHHGATVPDAYRVRDGDTLYAIAWRYGRDFRDLARWNGIAPPYTIYPGQRIRLTPGSRLRRQRTDNGPLARADARNREAHHTRATENKVKADPGRHARRQLKWRWPARGRVVQLRSPLGKKGVDIRGKPGQEILAAESGEVVYSGSGLMGYGQLIIIKHNDMFLSAYAHNSSLYVKEGTRVRAGQKIAAMGRSGNDIVGLHFEIRRNGKPVPPLRYLPRK